MKKFVIFLYMLLVVGLPLSQAEWLHNGIPVIDSPYAKTVGEFGAMLVFTDKPDELFEAWDKDAPGVSANFDVVEIKQNSSLTAAIIFSNCTPDEKGMANVTVKFTVLDPNGNNIRTGQNQGSNATIHRISHEAYTIQVFCVDGHLIHLELL